MQRGGRRIKRGCTVHASQLKPTELFSGHGIIDQRLNHQALITLRDSDFNYIYVAEHLSLIYEYPLKVLANENRGG